MSDILTAIAAVEWIVAGLSIPLATAPLEPPLFGTL